MSLVHASKIGASSLNTHADRLEMLAHNIANLDTPGYRRKIPVIEARENISFRSVLEQARDNVFKVGVMANVPGGTSLSGYIFDPTPAKKNYMPGHPDADKDGFVMGSNVNVLVDMADAQIASRAYEASLQMISITRSMVQKAMEIGRG